MKILLISIGTRGDIEPFLAIAQQFQNAHYEVCCAFPEQFRAATEDAGLPFKGIPIDLLSLSRSDASTLITSGTGHLFKRIRAYWTLLNALKATLLPLWQSEKKILEEFRPDKIIFHPLCDYTVGWSIADDVKAIMVPIYPFSMHSVDDHSYMTPRGSKDRGVILNRLSFGLMHHFKAEQIYKSCKKLGIHNDSSLTIKKIKHHLLHKMPARYCISPSLFEKPKEWQSNIQIIGHRELQCRSSASLTDQIKQFISSHQNIVLISFGSMVNNRPLHYTQTILDVLATHQIAAIISTGMGGLQLVQPHPEHVLFVNFIPYESVLPKMYAMVHHGGVGSTHSGVKYGCVSIVIPHILDQLYWGELIFQKELGPKPIHISKLSRTLFESTLLDALHNKKYKVNAERMSLQMAQESDPEDILSYFE